MFTKKTLSLVAASTFAVFGMTLFVQTATERFSAATIGWPAWQLWQQKMRKPAAKPTPKQSAPGFKPATVKGTNATGVSTDGSGPNPPTPPPPPPPPPSPQQCDGKELDQNVSTSDSIPWGSCKGSKKVEGPSAIGWGKTQGAAENGAKNSTTPESRAEACATKNGEPVPADPAKPYCKPTGSTCTFDGWNPCTFSPGTHGAKWDASCPIRCKCIGQYTEDPTREAILSQKIAELEAANAEKCEGLMPAECDSGCTTDGDVDTLYTHLETIQDPETPGPSTTSVKITVNGNCRRTRFCKPNTTMMPPGQTPATQLRNR